MSEQSSSNAGRHCEAPAGPWQSASPGGKETVPGAAAPARNDLFATPVAPFSKRGVASGVPDAGGIGSDRRASDTAFVIANQSEDWCGNPHPLRGENGFPRQRARDV
jgi:hypothetical protein